MPPDTFVAAPGEKERRLFLNVMLQGDFYNLTEALAAMVDVEGTASESGFKVQSANVYVSRLREDITEEDY
jgi:hypothetical protein